MFLGVFGMALGKISNSEGERTVYFHPFVSTKEFSVQNSVLKNESYVTSPKAYYAFKVNCDCILSICLCYDLFFNLQLLGERGMNTQATSEFYDDKTDVIFYTQINRDAIGCWNSKKPYTPENQGIIDSDSETLVFPNDLKVDPNGKLWVLSDRLSTYLYGDWKRDKNYRILTGDTKTLIKGTPCEN